MNTFTYREFLVRALTELETRMRSSMYGKVTVSADLTTAFVNDSDDFELVVSIQTKSSNLTDLRDAVNSLANDLRNHMRQVRITKSPYALVPAYHSASGATVVSITPCASGFVIVTTEKVFVKERR